MKDHIKAYKDKLGAALCDYMDKRVVTEASAAGVREMAKCWMLMDDLEKKSYKDYFSHDDAKAWADKLVNDDGTTGPHWAMMDTTAVAQSNGVTFDHITDWCWWIAMNMMYSDYCGVAQKYSIDTPDFYADLAKAFLFDKDGPAPECKLGAYYHGIVEA